MKYKFKFIGTEQDLIDNVIDETKRYHAEPSEWVLDSGYVLNEAEMYVKKEYITIIKEQEK